MKILNETKSFYFKADALFNNLCCLIFSILNWDWHQVQSLYAMCTLNIWWHNTAWFANVRKYVTEFFVRRFKIVKITVEIPRIIIAEGQVVQLGNFGMG